MFSKMKNIETAFKHVRTTTVIIVIGSLTLCGLSLYKSYQLAQTTQSKVYVIVNGKAVEAFAADRKDNIEVEAKDHIAMFHHYFFTLDPDEKVIQNNLSRALYMADVSAKKQYENLKENGYYANIISANISQQITIDSISVSTLTPPYYFKCYAKEQIIRTTSIATRNLVTDGFLRSVGRSENNSHGFLIEKWNIIENKDIKTVAR
jgi:conjugative transposon TraK protein